jgi:hypothetical protein
VRLCNWLGSSWGKARDDVLVLAIRCCFDTDSSIRGGDASTCATLTMISRNVCPLLVLYNIDGMHASLNAEATVGSLSIGLNVTI